MTRTVQDAVLLLAALDPEHRIVPSTPAALKERGSVSLANSLIRILRSTAFSPIAWTP